MAKPIVRLPAAIYADVELYLSRGWRRNLIVHAILANHGCELPLPCITAIKEGRKCYRNCGPDCPVKPRPSIKEDYKIRPLIWTE